MSSFPSNLWPKQKNYLLWHVPDISQDSFIHFFLINYKCMLKTSYTFDGFELLIISSSPCLQSAICFSRDISHNPVSWVTVTKGYLYPANKRTLIMEVYPLSSLRATGNISVRDTGDASDLPLKPSLWSYCYLYGHTVGLPLSLQEDAEDSL